MGITRACKCLDLFQKSLFMLRNEIHDNCAALKTMQSLLFAFEHCYNSTATNTNALVIIIVFHVSTNN